MSEAKKVEVYDPKKKRFIVVGQIRAGVFIKKVKKNHFCWKHRAFGLQLDAWSELASKKVKQLMFHYNRRDYVISWDKANQVKIGDSLGGHGRQYFIKIEECECC